MSNVSVDVWRVYANGDNRKVVGSSSAQDGKVVVSSMFSKGQTPGDFRLLGEDLSILISRLEEGGYRFLELEDAKTFSVIFRNEAPAVGHWLIRAVEPQERPKVLDTIEQLCVDLGRYRNPGEGVFFRSDTVELKYGDTAEENVLSPALEGAGQLREGDEELLVVFCHLNKACSSNSLVRLASSKGEEIELGKSYEQLKEAAGKLGFDLAKIRSIAETSRLVVPLVNLAELKQQTEESLYF